MAVGDKVRNNQVLLRHFVTGFPKDSDFQLRESTVELSIPQGSGPAVRVKNLYLSCDPYMRTRMAKSLQPISGYWVLRVIDSTLPNLTEGEGASRKGSFAIPATRGCLPILTTFVLFSTLA
ncbi:hypothetical protein MLD38_039707 [Melastoma candidum]|uniref:Uncharacterized protein n=1 Tax=Melastoma candidum TaxID=119954 RepID=A0ACB9L429_9MYRT|nr:hypothetical protein MLD38_039707 [Melastoma candidum]